jgi:hypothetical protein
MNNRSQYNRVWVEIQTEHFRISVGEGYYPEMGFTAEELNRLWESVGIERKEIPEGGDVPIFNDTTLSRGAAHFVCASH